MHWHNLVKAVCLAWIAGGAIAVPLPQGAGVGAGCDSVLSSTDNGVGYGVENAEENTAGLIGSVKGGYQLPPPPKRQLAGEGAACNSIFSSTDNGVGYGVENAADNTANLIAPVGKGIPPPAKRRRQLDKIANGAGALGNAAGVGAVTGPVAAQGDTIDGQTTDDAATLGAQIGTDEETALSDAGSLVP